jgi:hypothetical protein
MKRFCQQAYARALTFLMAAKMALAAAANAR